MPTTHNLAEQLAWLLETSPHVPPAAQPHLPANRVIANVWESLPAETTDTSRQDAIDSLRLHVPAAAVSASAAVPAQLGLSDQDMAGLRDLPVADARPLPLQMPEWTWPDAAASVAPFDQAEDALKEALPNNMDASQSQTQSELAPGFDTPPRGLSPNMEDSRIIDAEAVDLSSPSKDSPVGSTHSHSATFTSRKKRKSTEFEAGQSVKQQASPRPAKYRAIGAQDDFELIDDVLLRLSSSPAPVKSPRPQLSMGFRVDSKSAPMPESGTARPATPTSSPAAENQIGQTPTPRMSQKERQEDSDRTPRAVVTTRHTSMVRGEVTIADSDDEDGFSNTVIHAALVEPGGTTVVPPSPSSFDQQRRILPITPTTPKDVHGPTKAAAVAAAAAVVVGSASQKLPTDSNHSSSGLMTTWLPSQANYEPLSESANAVLQKVLACSSQHFEDHIRRLSAEKRSVAEAIVASLDFSDIPAPEMMAKSHALRDQLQAANALIQALKERPQLMAERARIKKKLVALIEEGTELEKYQADVQANRDAVRNCQALDNRIVSLASATGLPVHELHSQATPVNSTSRQNVVVHSTQAAAFAAYGQGQEVHTADFSSQFIRQTPPSHERTPLAQKHGRFEDVRQRPFDKATRLHANNITNSSKAKESTADSNGLHGRRSRYNEDDPFVSDFGMQNHEDSRGFSNIMGSPPASIGDEDEDFGYEDDLQEMLQAADDGNDFRCESRSMPPPAQTSSRRVPLAESSGNGAGRKTSQGSPMKLLSQNRTTTYSAAQLTNRQPWSMDLEVALKRRFNLQGFRHNQLAAIDATLGGKDVFVLMPTGGGKSLCYQLPAIINSGQTRGVTVVVSPLLSLMQDQVAHMQELNIRALLINGELSVEERREVFNKLKEPDVEEHVQLLYVTPEMLSKSQQMLNIFDSLHRRRRLARLVIDEAHCVSQWGHDFRPDYKQLGDVRSKLPGVPVMALTATATENVKVDVIHNLNIKGCLVFSQTFNRENLTYEVIQKGKGVNVLQSMVTIIRSQYANQCGIVYCASRKKCEIVAQSLKENYRIRAEHYHAGMDSKDRAVVQSKWQKGQCHVIVATIAFGMGINKPDVRFVMHHSLPKSLEGYYQETGRAGRDGEPSGCYLYYHFKDTVTIRKMIESSEGSFDQKQRQHQMLRKVVGFCENKTDCRRVQVLAYFGENFPKEQCQRCCDNCKTDASFETRDLTQYGKMAIKLVENVYRENVTLLQCVDLLCGKKPRRNFSIECSELDGFGFGKDLDKGLAERLFHRLLNDAILGENNVVNGSGFTTQYLVPGRGAAAVKNGRTRIEIAVRTSPDGKATRDTGSKTKKGKRSKAATEGDGSHIEPPLSTNVSSPARPVKRKKQQSELSRKAAGRADTHGNLPAAFGSRVRENEFSDDDFGFGRVRTGGQSNIHAQRGFGEPITLDEKMERLNSTHRLIIDDFVSRAKAECNRILMERKLREVPFTDTMLREMAIHFPANNTELLEIPGIDPDKVERYGANFIKLAQNAKEHYASMVQANEGVGQARSNQNVIDLVSDDDAFSDGDFDYSSGESAREGEDQVESPVAGPSKFFARTSVQKTSRRGTGKAAGAGRGGSQQRNNISGGPRKTSSSKRKSTERNGSVSKGVGAKAKASGTGKKPAGGSASHFGAGIRAMPT